MQIPMMERGNISRDAPGGVSQAVVVNQRGVCVCEQFIRAGAVLKQLPDYLVLK